MEDYVKHLGEGSLGRGLIDLVPTHQMDVITSPHRLSNHITDRLPWLCRSIINHGPTRGKGKYQRLPVLAARWDSPTTGWLDGLDSYEMRHKSEASESPAPSQIGHPEGVHQEMLVYVL